jgi:hypothetical protein
MHILSLEKSNSHFGGTSGGEVFKQKVSIFTEIIRGAEDTLLLLAMRWRNLRNPLSKWGILAGILFLGFIMLVSINLGYAVRIMALQGNETASGIFALSWILSLQRNEIGEVGAITLGGALAAAIFAPFTGSSTLTLAPVEDLQGLRLSRLHRFFDSFLINCISGIGILQLAALTAITSVLSLDGFRGPALIVTWMVWIFIIALTTTIGWILEWSLRRWGKAARWRAAFFLLAGIGVALALDPYRGRTLFGIGDLYASMMKSAGSGTLVGFVVPMLIMIAIILVTMFLGLLATREALNLPAPVLQRVKERKYKKFKNNPEDITTKIVLNSVWRTPEARRPILSVVAIGIPALMIVSLSENIEAAIMLAVPLAVSLSCGVNVFGILGGGMSWLGTQPRIVKIIPSIAGALQVLTTLFLVVILWTASFISGNTDPETGARLLVGGIVAATLSTIISLDLSIRHPIRARLSGRGDALIPPLAALNYLVRLLIFACLPAALAASAQPEMQLPIVLICIILYVFAIKVLTDRFSNPVVRSKIIAEVSAN